MDKQAVIGIGVVVVVVAGLAGWLFYGQPAMAKEKAMEYIANQLADPSSARFRFVRMHGGSVCGEVSGRNHLGLPTGFKRFYVSSGALVGEIEPELRDAAAFGNDRLGQLQREMQVERIASYRRMEQIHCVL